jgi:hypothetical protein
MEEIRGEPMVGYPYLIIPVLNAAHLLRGHKPDFFNLGDGVRHGPRASALRHVINAVRGSPQA